MPFWPVLRSVALLGCLSGCDLTSPEQATDADTFVSTAPENAAAVIPGVSSAKTVEESLLFYGGRPAVTDARLLYLAAYHQQTLGQSEALTPTEVGQRLAAHAGRALGGGDADFALNPPLISLVSMTVGTRDHSHDFGPLYAREILRRPSLTLLGTVPAAGALPGSPAYGALLEALFAQGEHLINATSLACQPGQPTLDGAPAEGGGPLADSQYWVTNVIHQQRYSCARRVKAPDRRDTLGLYQIGVAAFPVHEAAPAVARDFGYAGITGALAPAGDPFVIVSLPWLDEFPHLGGDQAAWTLLDEIKGVLPAGWYYLLSAAPPGATGAALELYAGRQVDGALTPAALGPLPY